MKVVERRLRNLESSFHSALQSIKEAADPFSDQTLVNLLAAGEWEFMMKLLDCKKRGDGPANLPPMAVLRPTPDVRFKRSNAYPPNYGWAGAPNRGAALRAGSRTPWCRSWQSEERASQPIQRQIATDIAAYQFSAEDGVEWLEIAGS
jgi:hypothetical protein